MTSPMQKGGKHRRRRGRNGQEQGVKNSKKQKRATDDSSTDLGKRHEHDHLLIQLSPESGSTWYEYGSLYPDRNATIQSNPFKAGDKKKHHNGLCPESMVEKYRSQADQLFDHQKQLAFRMSQQSKDDQWIQATVRKGTLQDRIAANSVMIGNDPVYRLDTIQGLLSMVGCSSDGTATTFNTRVAQMAAEALEDLFLRTLLPTDRKLIPLSQRPLHLYESSSTNKKQQHSLSPRILLLWRYEERVQEYYHQFIRHYLSSTLQQNTMEDRHKQHTLRVASNLLRSCPQYEDLLLTLIVNKLGDPRSKVATAAAHQLRLVLQQHPVMQTVVAREVQQLAHRPQLSSRALYQCVIFLNQLKLQHQSSSDSLATSLIHTYFRLFAVALNKSTKHTTDDGVKARLVSALLTGVNRAHPYVPEEDQVQLEEYVDDLYRLVHTTPPAACTQALMLLFHWVIGSPTDDDDVANADSLNSRRRKKRKAVEGEDGTKPPAQPHDTQEAARRSRFYRALYATIADPVMTSAGKHLTMYFNLLYKAIKYDTDMTRVSAVCKRLVATTLHAPNAAILSAALFLLNEISGKIHRELAQSYGEVHEGNKQFLDYTKRDPRGALVRASDEEGAQDDTSDLSSPDMAPGWEITLSMNHYHPSVQRFAASMGGDSTISSYYSGDPLNDFSLSHFLDKFAYRNPKSAQALAEKHSKSRSVAERKSVMQRYLARPVNDPSFWKQSSVEPENEFFRQFFVERARRDDVKGIVRYREPEADDVDTMEGEALDMAEQQEVDVDDDFAKYEAQWDSDSDEEAFIDSLAQKMIVDSIESHGPAELDDEDPDMSGWGDLDDMDADDGSDSGDSEEDEEKDDSSQSDAETRKEEDVTVAGMLGKPDSSEEDSLLSGDDDPFVEASDFESDMEDSRQTPSEKALPESSFAAAEDYEGMIEKSWRDLGRSR